MELCNVYGVFTALLCMLLVDMASVGVWNLDNWIQQAKRPCSPGVYKNWRAPSTRAPADTIMDVAVAEPAGGVGVGVGVGAGVGSGAKLLGSNTLSAANKV